MVVPAVSILPTGKLGVGRMTAGRRPGRMPGPSTREGTPAGGTTSARRALGLAMATGPMITVHGPGLLWLPRCSFRASPDAPVSLHSTCASTWQLAHATPGHRWLLSRWSLGDRRNGLLPARPVAQSAWHCVTPQSGVTRANARARAWPFRQVRTSAPATSSPPAIPRLDRIRPNCRSQG